MLDLSAKGNARIEMADTDQLAHALIEVLQHSPRPEPLGVDLMNHSPTQAVEIVMALVAEATAANASLALVVIDPALMTPALRENPESFGASEGIAIRADPRLSRRMELYRSLPKSP